MKVLQIITSLQTGGAEKLLVDIVPRLNQKGITCEILTLIDEETSFRQELEERNVKVFGLSKTMNVYDPRFIFKIKPWLKQYDIVHTHLFQPQYWTGIAKSLFSPKTLLITTEHSTTNRRRTIKIYKACLLYTSISQHNDHLLLCVYTGIFNVYIRFCS